MNLLAHVLLGLAALWMPHIAAAQQAEDVARFGGTGTEILLRSTTDIGIIRPVLDAFVAANPDLSVRYEQWGSNDLFANSRAACAGEIAAADAVLSSAVHHMVWLANAACAAPYRSPQTAALPQSRRWRDELWGITEEPAVIIYNRDAIRAEEAPRDRFALLDLMRSQPDLLRGRIATYDIQASGLGYLFAHADSLEATSFGALLEGFARVDAVTTCCSAEIINGVATGDYLIAYNVLGSYIDTAEVSEKVGVILPSDYTLILSRSLMIPRNAAHGEAAGRLLDFLLAPGTQHLLSDIGLAMVDDNTASALLPSARRPITLNPSLLVALDAHRRQVMLDLWKKAFIRGEP